jgi:hypothetical protein
LNGYFASLLLKIFKYYLLTLDFERMRFFLRTFWRTATEGPFSVAKWLDFFRWISIHRAFRKYVMETHGIPESADPKNPPFTSLEQTPTDVPRERELASVALKSA